jgi:MEDS: MEthanogen/methylotroph, DcmR Sensory domain/Response regulator receiver domain
LQPDLILLDIGLPKLNGIEAARQIRKLSTQPKILFVSQNHSTDIANAALRLGATGYLVKSDAAGELLTAVEAVLQGKTFVSGSVAGSDFMEALDTRASEGGSLAAVAPAKFASGSVRERGHVVQFYTDDADLLDSLCTLFKDVLKAGESIVAVITRSHRKGLQKRLLAQGIDGAEAKKQGWLTILDAGEALRRFMDANGPNRERFLLQFGDIFRRAEAAGVAKNKRVVAYGEMVAVLGEQKKFDALIRLEQLWNELAINHSFYLCCAYPASLLQEKLMGEVYSTICAVHSKVVSL